MGTETNCEHCGRCFVQSRSDQRFCRTRCQTAGNSRRCDLDDCDRPHRAKGRCNFHYRLERGYELYAFREDPDAKKRRDLIKSKRRRAIIRGVEHEAVDRDVVGIRDGWRCGICGKRVDRALRSPHPMSPSLDHIIPLSRLGPHTYANCRIAHLRCNNLRGNRIGNEQLLLFGEVA